MGTRGPQPQTAALRALRGGAPGFGATPAPLVALPEPPAHLAGEAHDEWYRVGGLMLEQGTITELDRAVLAAYCSTWATHVEIQRQLADAPLVVDGPRGREVENPLLRTAHRVSEQLTRLAAHLGLTPASRNRAAVGTREPVAEDKFAEFRSPAG